MDYQIQRIEMVRDQIQARSILDARVIDAMLAVAREMFVPLDDRGLAYDDHPLPIGNGQTISQPYIVALMTELLELPTNGRVLEIGAGCGYQTAILAQLADEVCAIERDAALTEQARRTLDGLGFSHIQLIHGDGFLGWPEPESTFDGILVGCAAPELPVTLTRHLKPGARLVIPIGPPDGAQQLVSVRKQPDGTLSTSTHAQVRFVPMTPGITPS